MATGKSTTDRHAVLPEGAVLVLRVDGAEQTIPLQRRTFSTGSIGYFAQGKVMGAEDRRYQVQLNATLIGSKPTS